MEQILKKVRNVDPNNSEAVKEALTSFFQCIPKYKELHSSRLLQELQLVLNRYPKYCFSHRNNLEQFLTGFLSSNNYFNVIEAAKCTHALQQVRPSQEKSATPRSSWRDQLSDLCNAAHTLIESLFTDAVEVFRNNKYVKPPKPASTPMSVALEEITRKLKDFKDKQSTLYLRLKNVLIFIQAMLVETYPVAKPVQPQTVLDLIVRLLSLTSGTKQYDENICAIKTQTLRTLDALIVCLGSNLIPYSSLVFRLVLQTLKWTMNNPNDHTSGVRCTAYRSLGAWLTTLHTHRLSHAAHSWDDELTDTLIRDITPAKKLVQLTMGPQPTRHLSKKAKRKLASSQLQESNLAVYAPGELNKISVSEEVNNKVAVAALECAETFLTVCGRFFKPATHKIYQERLVRECYNYSSYSGKHEHLLRLLRVLEATRKTTPHGVPPTTQYCLHLYSLLVNDRRPEISKFCSQALLDIRLHLHCSPPSLNFAMEALPETKQAINKRKKVSNRNRAMLESLLGANKIPQEIVDEEEDVISIPDEPSAKKPRLESDETDQISLSSDSESSVEEVCDEYEDVVEEINEVEGKQNENTEPMIIEEQENEELNTETTEQEINELNHEETDIQESIQQNKEEKTNGNTEVHEDDATAEAEIDKGQEDLNIYEAQTQIPINVSNDTIEEERRSLEIVYDFPSTGKEKVAVLEKLDDENLPSTNDTDDIQITCGQVVRSSQEVDLEKKTIETELKTDEIHVTPEVNGLVETVIENGVADKTPDFSEKNNLVDNTTKNDKTSVEDMLADFVDEVNDDPVEA